MSDSPESELRLTDEQRLSYRQALERVGAGTPCGRCGAPFEQFGVAPGQHPITFFQLHEAIAGVQETHMLTLVLMCTKCGAIYMHAAGLVSKLAQASGSDD